MMSALQTSSLHLISQSLKHKHCKLKPVLTAVLLAFAVSAQAATFISTGDAEITADPNAAPAVSITGQHVLQISTPVITGDVTTTAGNQGALVLNGTTTINGNIGTATNFLAAFATGYNSNFTSRLADGDVYRLNGLVNVGVFYVNIPSTQPDGLSFNSSVILGGDLNANQGMYWFAPIASKVSTLDLQGNVLVSGTSLFVENAGDLRLISTITADGGQTACVAGINKAGCISSGISTALPANLQVQVRVANGVTLTTGTKYNLIDFAPGGPVAPTLSSNITSLTSGFSFVQDTANTEDIVFEVTGVPVIIPFFVSNANVKAPAKPAAAVLDELSATAIDSGMIAAISALQGLNPAQQAATLNRIAPETSRASVVASMQTINGALDSVQARIEGERDQGFNLSLSDDLQQGKVKLATNGDTTDLFSAGDNRSFWVKGFGAHGNQNETNSYAGYNSNTWGAAFGADTLLSNNWLVGAAFTYARTGVNMSDFRSGDETNIKTYQLTGYTSHNFGGWYLDGMLAYAKQDYDSSRNTNLTGVASADFSGDQVAARVNVGMPYALGNNLTLTPIAGLEWNHLKQDSYTEKGAGALSLKVNSDSTDRLRSMLGAKLSTEKTVGEYTIVPSMHAAWRHDFNDSSLNTTSSFLGGGAAFNTPGQDLPSNTFNVGAAISIQKSKDFNLSLTLDGESASGYKAASGQVVGQWKF